MTRERGEGDLHLELLTLLGCEELLELLYTPIVHALIHIPLLVPRGSLLLPAPLFLLLQGPLRDHTTGLRCPALWGKHLLRLGQLHTIHTDRHWILPPLATSLVVPPAAGQLLEATTLLQHIERYFRRPLSIQ